MCVCMYVCMYVCIYTTTGASYPPHPNGGGWEHGTRDHISIYCNIYHQYTPNVSIYTSTMDPRVRDVVGPQFLRHF